MSATIVTLGSMKVIECEQGTPEWLAARAGRVTASRICDVLSRAKDRKSEGATRRKYRAQLIAEILSGRPQQDSYTNGAMENGTELEPLARGTYMAMKGVDVEPIGLVIHPTIAPSERCPEPAASPDGLVDGIEGEGLVQFKCPEPQTHIDYRLDGSIPAKYLQQMQWEMACTGRKWCDFVSYCPTFDGELGLYVARVDRDDAEIQRIAAEVIQLRREVDEVIERLTKKAA